MSFVDNLENNLKALESQDERDSAKQTQNRDAERSRSRSVQPNAEALRKSPFTAQLLDHAVRLAHGLRTKVYISWAGNNLRLDAREHRLELQPRADGIDAVYLENQREIRREPLDLNGDAQKLAQSWLDRVGPRPPAAAAKESG